MDSHLHNGIILKAYPIQSIQLFLNLLNRFNLNFLYLSMKKILFILLLIISFIGFGQNETKKEYWDNGQIKSVEYYKNGKRDGTFSYYFENGKIRTEKTWKDGKLDGKDIWYFENGQIGWEENWKDGTPDGKFIYYYENGQKRYEKHYKNGELIEPKHYYRLGN